MKTDSCGCCEGTEQLTPLTTANRPGLDALSYRVGTHATFLETMKARLASMCISEDGECDEKRGLYPLQALTTRESNDPAIAFLDAWATVGDVLTFYQERIANEGYLRTATERRSILELANLVGYRLRPGVSASVYLAFLLEDSYEGATEIPAGTRAQSLPGPGEEPQPFETSEPLSARAEWNQIRPRLNRPQELVRGASTLYLKGTDTNLEPGDSLLFDFGDRPTWRRVAQVEPHAAAEHTKVTLHGISQAQAEGEEVEAVALEAVNAVTLPDGLRADRWNSFVAGLVTIGESDESTIAALLREFSDALLATFDALAKTPPSAGRNETIAQDIDALEQIEQLLRRMLNISSAANIHTPLAQMHDWSTQALEILESAGSQPTEYETVTTNLNTLVNVLSAQKDVATIPPPTPFHLATNTAEAYTLSSDLRIQATATLLPHLLDKSTLYQSLRTAQVSEPATTQVYALRMEAAPFGHNAPPRPVAFDNGIYTYDEWNIDDPLNKDSSNGSAETPGAAAPAGDTVESPHHKPTTLFLDNEYDLEPGSWLVVDSPNVAEPIILKPAAADIRPRSLIAYGLSGKTIEVDLSDNPWFEEDDAGYPRFDVVRDTRVYLQSEELELAEAPLPEEFPATDENKNQIVINGLYGDLKPGRWLIVSGERADIAGVSGVRASELVMLQNVEQDFDEFVPGDTYHTRLTFANDLAHTYKRETLTVYANVTKATHGETREEVLGSGDGSKEWQQFTLKQAPLTFLAAPTPDGATSTLLVRVNDILWQEADNHFTLNPTDRAYVPRTDNEDKTTVIFGDGEHGARLPTGAENVTAVYRSGIGRPGNVRAEQIKLLASRPLGVKGVINPLAATGGADREDRDQARRNAPLAVMALDRLVSVQDYADFARTFAGIGKARATSLTDGRQEIVYLTIAGADDIPIAESSDLYRNLHAALQRAGDPHQPFEIAVRELLVLVIVGRVRIHPDYLWEKVSAAVRSALLEAFSFESRTLGQDALLSEVISVMQHVPGVTYVDVDVLATISETEAKSEDQLAEKLEMLAPPTSERPDQRITVELARRDKNTGERLPAQLAFLSPDLPDTLVLQEITS